MMAEVTNELIYEVLRAMQTRLANIENAQEVTNARLNSMQTHLIAIEQDVANIYGALGSLDSRVSRIERRLDLVDQGTRE